MFYHTLMMFDSLNPIHFHCMGKSSVNILLNIFCVSWKKKSQCFGTAQG